MVGFYAFADASKPVRLDLDIELVGASFSNALYYAYIHLPSANSQLYINYYHYYSESPALAVLFIVLGGCCDDGAETAQLGELNGCIQIIR